MKLYDHQDEAVSSILYCLEMEGMNTVALDAPTSFGKSLVLSEVAAQLTGKVIILVNISALIDQIAEHLVEIGAEFSILKAGYEDQFDPSKKIQLVMSQTFFARYEKIDLGDISWVLQDEGHRETWSDRTKHLLDVVKPDGRLLVSGTPFDSKGYALKDVDETIQTITIPELQEQGYVSPVEYFVPKWSEQIDYSSLRMSGEDYSGTAIDELINTDSYADMAVQSMNKMDGKSKKTLVFANSIEHANTLAEALNQDGYSAYSYHSENDPKEAAEAMESFKTGESSSASLFGSSSVVKCVVAVSKISIGFSVKDITLLVLCRPTKVLSLYRQIVGRGIRTHPNKTSCELLDLASCVSTHGFHDEPYEPPVYGNKEELTSAKESLQAEAIEYIAGDEPTKITRKMIVDKVDEIKRDSNDISKLSVDKLSALFNMTSNLHTACHIAFEMNFRTKGIPYKENTVGWAIEPSLTMIEDYPEYKLRLVKTIKTRMKSIVRDGKKLAGIYYFPEWLSKQVPYSIKSDDFEIV